METLHREKRKLLRHPIHLPIQLQPVSDKKMLDSESGDISLGGLNFVWPTRLAKGIFLTIHIPVKKKLFEVKAKVVYSRLDKKTPGFRTGVSFVDTSSAFKARLAEEVLQIMEYQKNASRDLGYELSEEEAAARWIREHAAKFPADR